MHIFVQPSIKRWDKINTSICKCKSIAPKPSNDIGQIRIFRVTVEKMFINNSRRRKIGRDEMLTGTNILPSFIEMNESIVYKRGGYYMLPSGLCYREVRVKCQALIFQNHFFKLNKYI